MNHLKTHLKEKNIQSLVREDVGDCDILHQLNITQLLR